MDDQLLCVAYERMELSGGFLDPHLWIYRTRITLDHLSLTLQQKGIKECPILHQFLNEVFFAYESVRVAPTQVVMKLMSFSALHVHFK